MKFRYVWKRKSDGKIWMEIVPIECIEGKGDVPFILNDWEESGIWELVARDRWTGTCDMQKIDVFENDIVKRPCYPKDSDGYVIKFLDGAFRPCCPGSDVPVALDTNIWYEMYDFEVVGNVYEGGSDG